MNNYLKTICFLSLFLSLFVDQAIAKKAKIAQHPSKLKYEKLDWEVPLGKPYRTNLPNGLKLYIAEDHSLPVVTVSGYFKAGSINDPDDKVGLGSFATFLMRTGGTEEIHPDTLDALIEHYAMSISLSLSDSKLNFSANFMSKFADTALYIIEQILFHPAFNKEKIEKERAISIQRIEHRFDNPEPILSVAYEKVMYPKGQNSRLSTRKSMEALTQKDLIDFHKSVIKTENAIFAVSGDINKKSFMEKLNKIFPKVPEKTESSDFPEIVIEPPVKFLIVHKEISQAYVRIGLPLFKRPNPDYYPMSVFSHILGGGGFTSRLTAKIRSDAGLTYSIYSRIGTNYIYPATFYINFFTKHATVNQAIDLSLKEVGKILKDGITPEELSNTKKVLIDGLPSSFRSKGDIVGTYAWNEYYNRPENQYSAYPGKIKALKKENINNIGKKYITPDKFTYVIVGDTTELFKAEKSDGFSIKEQTDIKIITPDMLYNTDLFKEK